jgi:tetratricopeptide (TPR) repeat protein
MMTRAKYPKAIKTMRMLAMFYEMQGEVAKAQEILLDMISEDPSDGQTVKRLVSLYRDMNMETQAIQVLNKHIEMNQENSEAWIELADIYLQKQNFTKALFCYEELLMHQPKNYIVNLRYAETLYSSARVNESFDEL